MCEAERGEGRTKGARGETSRLAAPQRRRFASDLVDVVVDIVAAARGHSGAQPPREKCASPNTCKHEAPNNSNPRQDQQQQCNGMSTTLTKSRAAATQLREKKKMRKKKRKNLFFFIFFFCRCTRRARWGTRAVAAPQSQWSSASATARTSAHAIAASRTRENVFSFFIFVFFFCFFAFLFFSLAFLLLCKPPLTLTPRQQLPVHLERLQKERSKFQVNRVVKTTSVLSLRVKKTRLVRTSGARRTSP